MTNKYYQKRKEILWKEGRERYQNLSEEEKDKRQKMVCDRYQSLPKRQTETPWVYEKLLFST